MKQKNVVLSILFAVIILACNVCFAAEGTVKFESSKKEVKKGDIVDVTLSVSSNDGINGIDTKYTYDTDKVELISQEVEDSSKWVNLGKNNEITIICNVEEHIKSSDIFLLKFKVKDDVKAGDVIKIETTKILMDTDLESNSSITVSPKKIELLVVDEKQDDEKQDDEKQDDEKQDDEKQDDEKQDDEKQDDNNNNGNNSNENVESGKTESGIINKILPQTGKSYIIIYVALFGLIVLSVIFYKKYKKIK